MILDVLAAIGLTVLTIAIYAGIALGAAITIGIVVLLVAEHHDRRNRPRRPGYIHRSGR